MIKNFTLAALAVIAVPTAAQAQQSATGARLELFIGIDDFEDDLGRDSDAFNEERERDLNAAIGANIGFDFIRGETLSVGADVEYVRSNAELPVFVNGARAGDLKYGSEIYGGGRVTFAVTPTIGLVGKVGYSFLDTEFTAAALQNSRDENLGGIRGSVGVQFRGAEDDRTYYGLEARYADYEQGLTRKGLLLVVGHRF
jgi:hypothetical protein